MTSRARGEHYDFVWHYHAQFEIFHGLHGVGQWLIGDQTGTFAPGDLFVLGPRLPHAFYTPLSAAASPTLPYDNQVVYFTLPASSTPALPEFRSLVPFQQRVTRGLRCFGETAEIIRARLHVLESQSGMRALLTLLDCLCLLGESDEVLPIATPRYLPASVAASSERINAICHFLHRHYTRAISLQEVAEYAHTSIANLCRFFKQWTGQTVLEYLQGLRIGHACHRLTETDESITAIAYASGFTAMSSFNRQFRALRGLTPREFRLRARGVR